MAMIAPTLPLQARTRKGDKFLAQGRIHESKKEWDAALEAYEQALSEDPSDLGYQMSAQRTRFQASAAHVSNGHRLRSQGQLGEALLEFQKGFALSPSSTVAEQEILRTQDMIQRERNRVLETGKESPPEVRALTPTEVARKDNQDKIDRLQSIPELKPLKPNLLDFKMINQTPKVLFETVALQAGLNVIWDPEYQSPLPAGKDKLSVTFTNSTVEEALDYLGVLTKSYWKPLATNTIFITMDTQNKRRDYEEEVTKVLYLSNATTNADLTQILTAARTVADCQRVFMVESQSAIVAKCTADRMALAEKIVHDLDKPRAEVVVDIYVIEASSIFTRHLTTALAATGLNIPANFTPRTKIQIQEPAKTPTGTDTGTGNTDTGSSTPANSIPLSALGHLASSDYSTVLPSALLQAALTDTKTKVLHSPQLRSVEGQKASMKIGEKQPTASGSFQPGMGGVAGGGISPLVNTQFTYLDVGVNVEILPHVHDNGDISMTISLEISNVSGNKNLGGIDAPIIGQRKIEQSIRLREGEVSLIGGILNQQESRIKTGIPGLASIPILGRLFSGESVDRERDEVMMALIPHVVRRPDMTPTNLRAIASGPQNTLQVRYGPKPADTPALQPPPGDAAEAAVDPGAAKTPTQPAAVPGLTGATPIPAGGAPPATAPPATAPVGVPGLTPPATAPPETPGGAPGAPAVPPAGPPGNARIRFSEAEVNKNVAENFTVTPAGG